VGHLQATDIVFRAGGKEILGGVSVTVGAGETLALLGPSGCGKTSLLRVIAGLQPATSGQIAFDDEVLTTTPPHRRGFGLMFQDHALFPHMNVSANVAFGLTGARWDGTARNRRVSELLEMVGLAGFETRSIDKLSGGERQRVALARTLAPEPRLLMLDEPLGSLDRELRERLLIELREILSRLQIPVIFVTHDQSEAFALADRVAIMRAGLIVRVGSPREIFEAPRTEFVARFLGLDTIVRGERVGGIARTAFGRFGPLPGTDGPVTVLLRAEGALPASAPGTHVVSGTVADVFYEGPFSVVKLQSEGERLSFRFPSSVLVAAPGETLHVAIAATQELAPS